MSQKRSENHSDHEATSDASSLKMQADDAHLGLHVRHLDVMCVIVMVKKERTEANTALETVNKTTLSDIKNQSLHERQTHTSAGAGMEPACWFSSRNIWNVWLL